mgnify:CR=1 FL=1
MLELNVLELLKHRNKSKYWLFNELNKFEPISYTNFNAMITNKTKSIKYNNIDKLCKILDCEPNDLFKRD